MLNNKTRERDNYGLLVTKSSQEKPSITSAIGEKKRLKINFIQNNPTVSNNVNLQINPKTWPSLKVDDILEISANSNSSLAQGNIQLNSSLNRSASNGPPNFNGINCINQSTPAGVTNLIEDETSPILLQIVPGSFNEAIPIDSIRVDQIASSTPFSFKAISYVNATIVDKWNVVLDLVEVLFKEQYLNGNDMLRIKKHMTNTCVYLKKNIELCGMRCSVREIWAPNGDRVTCGYIGDKTRVLGLDRKLVFRSQSAMCTIYIQMSREMWEFDVNGEMYHEKAVNFLGELFTNWKSQACTHDVTIALFSRVFYNAKSLDDFPDTVKQYIKSDHKNRFYEDFYRVIYQNERFEDWTPTLVILKRLIKEYRDYILNYHKNQSRKHSNIPTCVLSSAAEGNFLETLILSSTVFERHFVDRPFDRTGMMSLVITPGRGIFEVSRELSKITKERVIDNAIGSDLVCLGESPLHLVPLFKYYDPSDAYDVPHWINLSFYKSSETVRYCNSKFLPSSKITIKSCKKNFLDPKDILPDYNIQKEDYQRSLEETDNIFEYYGPKSLNSEPFYQAKKTTSKIMVTSNSSHLQNQNSFLKIQRNKRPSSSFMGNLNDITNLNLKKNGYLFNKHNNSESDLSAGFNSASLNSELNEGDDDDSLLELDTDPEQNPDSTVNFVSKRIITKVNPFCPSSFKPKMSFERRRWAHTFPLRSDGTPIYDHWISVQTNTENPIYMNENNLISFNQNCSSYENQKNFDLNEINKTQSNQNRKYNDNSRKSSGKIVEIKTNQKWILNREETKSFMRPGVAWKSLTTPACLPLTTDFFPSKKTWESKFSEFSNYTLLLEDIREQYGCNNYQYNKNISMDQVFYELVGHRLAMGFQMVVNKNTFHYKNNNDSSNTDKSSFAISSNASSICDLLESSVVKNKSVQISSIKGYYKLSLGRIYHEIFLIADKTNNNDCIKVIIHMPKKKINSNNNNKENRYTYRFQVPDSKTYYISFVNFTRKNAESIKWNLIDSYICIQGNGSLTPNQLNKCWRQRIYLIPTMYSSSKSIGKQPNAQIQNDHLNYFSTLFKFSSMDPGVIPASMLENAARPVNCDIFTRKSLDELKFIRDYNFIRFMEGLNKLNRADERKLYSRATINYSETMNIPNSNSQSGTADQCLGISVIMNSIQCNSFTSNNQNSTSTASTNKIAITNQSYNVPNLTKNQSSNQLNQKLTKTLISPKVKLWNMVLKYNADLDEVERVQKQDPKAYEVLKMQNDALKLEIYTYLNTEYKGAMMNPQSGFVFFQNKNDIPPNCFPSAEAVWWCMENIDEIETEADAIIMMQIMCDFDIVCHISKQQKFKPDEQQKVKLEEQLKVFVHGFYLYYFLIDKVNYIFTKDYCEVGFCDVDCGSSKIINPVFVNDLLPESKASLPVSSNEMFSSYKNLISKYSRSSFGSVTSDSILKLVNVDVDPTHKSSRVEWASAVYRSHYHQLCAFELEIQWEVATGQLLTELAAGWSKLANRYNFHIVPTPIDPFACPIVPNADPLRGPIFINFNFACLISNESESVLFDNFIDKKYKLKYTNFDAKEEEAKDTYFESSSSISSASTVISLESLDELIENNKEFMTYVLRKFNNDKYKIRMRISEEREFLEDEFHIFLEYKRIFRLMCFQEACLEKFGFVKNAAIVKTLHSDDDPTFFIHCSGGMFVCLPNYYTNYNTSRSRHGSANSGHNFSTTATSMASKSTIYSKASEEFDIPLSRTSESNDQIDKSGTLHEEAVKILNTHHSHLINKSKTSSNSLSNSYVSSSTITANCIINNSSLNYNGFFNDTNVQSLNGTNVGMAYVRERSNTKSQHHQYLKLNDVYTNESPNYENFSDDLNKIYPKDEIIDEDTKSLDEMDSKSEEDPKNDLLFRPKSTGYDPRFGAKSNEKLDLLQRQQREEISTQLLQLTDQTEGNLLDLSKSNKRQPFHADPDCYIGFSWSWNFMLGKRWRSMYTGDETFQDNALADFRIFCSNEDGRLLKFYNELKNDIDKPFKI